MSISKSLRRPINWQDFETLCKKLWSEIWNYPETKKNGRSGQEQYGVDVYGIPEGENKYYGIQCKGKDEYSNKQFTIKEIEVEISKASQFQPLLKKFYLVTTALKDVKIEEYIRKKNIDQIAKGLFEVHIFCWEDIVDLIDENKQTHNWYVKNVNFKLNKSVKITFQNDTETIILTPKFKKHLIHKRKESHLLETRLPSPLDDLLGSNRKFYTIQGTIINSTFSKTEVNYSYSKIYFKIHNTGEEPIEEFQLIIQILGDVMDLNETNTIQSGLNLFFPSPIICYYHIDNVQKNVKFTPRKKILVGDDVFKTDSLYIKPKPEEYDFKIKWKLISKDFKDEGEMKVVVEPEFVRDITQVVVDDISKVGTEIKNIEDFIEIIPGKSNDD